MTGAPKAKQAADQSPIDQSPVDQSPVDQSPIDPLTTAAVLASEWVEAVEAAAAGVLEAEIEAVQAILAPDRAEDEAAREAARRRAEGEIEDGFDNLPV